MLKNPHQSKPLAKTLPKTTMVKKTSVKCPRELGGHVSEAHPSHWHCQLDLVKFTLQRRLSWPASLSALISWL